MASPSLIAFESALAELGDLERADPTPVGAAPIDSDLTRVVGRASVVLLSSHFERYVYGANEDATRIINDEASGGAAVPEMLRLLHSRPSVDTMLETAWERRAEQLMAFVESESWLWGGAARGSVDHERLLVWMKAPTPRNLVRYYRYWGIPDIFDAITRARHTRTDLRLKIDELVRKRNNIAHGDPTTEATHADIRQYRDSARRFCERADRRLARSVSSVTGGPSPW